MLKRREGEPAGLLERIRTRVFPGPRKADAAARPQTRAIVDLPSFFGARSRHDSPHPSEVQGLLRRLAAFADREQCSLAVVTTVKPAGVPNKTGFLSLHVCPSPKVEEEILSLARHGGHGATTVVVTADPQIEQTLSDSRVGLMRPVTLRRAMEVSLGPVAPPPPPRPRPPDSRPPQREERAETTPTPAPAPAPKEEHNPVLDLIDPL